MHRILDDAWTTPFRIKVVIALIFRVIVSNPVRSSILIVLSVQCCVYQLVPICRTSSTNVPIIFVMMLIKHTCLCNAQIIMSRVRIILTWYIPNAAYVAPIDLYLCKAFITLNESCIMNVFVYRHWTSDMPILYNLPNVQQHPGTDINYA